MARKSSAALLEDDTRAELKQRLSSLMEAANNEMAGSLAYLDGSTARWSDDRIIPSGSLDLDMAIGTGGWPRGRVVEIYGQESSGKTTLCLHTVREAQKKGIVVVYIDAENALDPVYMKRLGVDVESVLMAQPSSLQNAMDLMVLLMEQAEELAPDGLLIVVDSIPALAPQEVLDASAEQQTRALAARYWSAQLPRIVNAAARTRSTLLLINQMRSGMDMYTPNTTPGGKAIKFNASVRVEVRRKIEGKNNEEGADGQHTNLIVVKNKVGSPFKKAYYFLPAGMPINELEDTVNVAISRGVILEDVNADGEKKKGWYTYNFGPGDLELVNKDRLDQWIADGNDEEEFEPLDDSVTLISEYRIGRLLDKMEQYPSLVAHMRERILDTLNEGQGLDEEAIEDMSQFNPDGEDLDDSEQGDEED